jgi:regulator-associated protein of mTOR
MTWINESFDALLALGADNGAVSVWRDTSTSHSSLQSNAHAASEQRGGGGGSGGGGGGGGGGGRGGGADNSAQENHALAASFFALPDSAETKSGAGMIMAWQQHSGTLVVGGNSSTIRLWDLGREQCVRVFSTGVDTCTTAIASKAVSTVPQLSGSGSGGAEHAHAHASEAEEHSLSWTFAGFADGSVAVFDERIAGSGRVATAREHSAWIVAAHLRPDVAEAVTASIRGSVKFWDLRKMRSFKTLEIMQSATTAMAVHSCAPIMAAGSNRQFIKILTLGGEQLGGIIKYHDGFLGQRIGPVSCLAFHPTKLLLAAGATDSIVSIYGQKKE